MDDQESPIVEHNYSDDEILDFFDGLAYPGGSLMPKVQRIVREMRNNLKFLENSLDVCAARRHEAEEKVGELLSENEGLRVKSNKAPMFERDPLDDEIR